MKKTISGLSLLFLVAAAAAAQPTQLDVSRVKGAAQLGTDGKVLASQLPAGTGGGGGGASTLNDLLGCTPVVAGKVITLPATCKVATATSSQAVAAPSNFTFDATTATPGRINIGFDSGVYTVWTSTTSYVCGAGASCVSSTPSYPNGVLRIASFTLTGNVLSAPSLDMTENQQKIVFAGANANDTTDPSTGIRTVSFPEQHTPRLVNGSSDALNDNDCGNEVIYKAGGAISVTIAQAGVGGLFKNGCRITISVQGSGATVTLTPAVSTVRGQSTFQMTTSPFRYVVTSDGQNYY